MNLISFTDVSLSLGDRPLFAEVTLGIDAGERIGFIGPNGAGKSTFLSLILGTRTADTGTISRRGDLTIGYLPQIPNVPPEATLGDLVFRSDHPRAALVREYESLLERYDENSRDELERLQILMDREGAWNLENTYHSFLDELGIHDLKRRADTLSGGELRKADLARVLATGADLLLLDEPTNHLDLETVEWLELWLKGGRGGYVLVTHDRSFLDSSCQVILELEESRIRKYPGNWSTYVSARAKRLEEERKSADRRLNILRRELEWASRRPKARATKDKKRLERIEDLQDLPQADIRRLSEFTARGRRLGKKVLELVNVEKSRGGRRVIAPFSYSFRRGERIGVAGPNGAGKTTLLSVVSGSLGIDGGRMDLGVNTRFAVLDQAASTADESLSVLDYMNGQAALVTRSDGGTVDVGQWLERFGFPPESRRRRIRHLSGGERRRLQLVRLLMEEPNFLILDEPTNDLDLVTLSLLEQFLDDFTGCLMVVSHDRTFLERVVDYFFILDGSGSVQGFSGTWSEFRETLTPAGRQPATPTQPARVNRAPRKGLSFSERRELETLMTSIHALEEELAGLESVFSLPDPDPVRLADAGRRHEPLKVQIADLTSRWEALAERDQ